MTEPPDQQILARQWATLAKDDLESAQELKGRGHPRQVCFLSQQTVEKFIKALLTSRQIPFDRTHNVEKLVALLEDAQALALTRPDVLDLSEYAIDARYPGYSADLLDEDDADRALSAARHVSQAIRKALNF